jgi:hypothetical protein
MSARQIVNLGDLTSDDLTRMHLAVEDELVEMRDAGLFLIGPRNGFVIYGRDGTPPSGALRLGTRDGLRIALAALFGVDPVEVPR